MASDSGFMVQAVVMVEEKRTQRKKDGSGTFNVVRVSWMGGNYELFATDEEFAKFPESGWVQVLASAIPSKESWRLRNMSVKQVNAPKSLA